MIPIKKFILVFLILLVSSGSVQAQNSLKVLLPSSQEIQTLDEITGKRVIWVLIDKMPLELLNQDNLPNLQKIWEQGAAALLNCRTTGGINTKNIYLTLGSGVKLKASDQSLLAYSCGEIQENQTSAGAEYFWLTGQTPPPDSILNLRINHLYNLNAKSNHDLILGTLGQTLHNYQLQTAVLGNSDYSKINPQKPGVLIAMDSQGLVDRGYIGSETLSEDPDFVNCFRTNYAQLLNYYQELSAQSSLIVIDLGDFSRIYQNWSYLSLERIDQMNQTALVKIDQFLGSLLEIIDPQEDLLVVTVPSPGYQLNQEAETDKITWTVLYNANLPSGLLYSPTTRRTGLIDNTDLVPALLNWLGCEVPEGVSGRLPSIARSNASSLVTLKAMADQLSVNNATRPIVTKIYIYLQMILLVLAGLLLWKQFKLGQSLKPCLFIVPLMPLVLLCLPLLPGAAPWLILLELGLLTALLTVLFDKLHKKTGQGWLILGLLLAGLILGDTLGSSSLQKASLFSYDPIVGARFYGIGNEYMGVCIGSVILGLASLYCHLQQHQKLFWSGAGLLCLLAVWIMAWPSLGTNVGGSIASMAAYLFLILLLSESKINLKIICGIIGLILIGMTGFIAYDLSRPAELQSHMGQAASLILSGGWAEVQEIIVRKLETNLRLLQTSTWGRVFILELLLLAFLYNQNNNKALQSTFKKWRSQNPIFQKGLTAVLLGAFVAAVFNDSGILSAVICTSYAIFPLLYGLWDDLYPPINHQRRK